MRHFCPHCLRETETHIDLCRESYPVLGEATKVPALVRVCDTCGGSIWDRALDGSNLEQAYAAYRVRHGLPPGCDLKRIVS